MSVIIVDNGSKYTEALLGMLAGNDLVVIDYSELDYKKLVKGDTVILTGGHVDPILWHKKQYAREVALIKHHKGPIIGICLGFELIAHVYGSHLHLLNERRKGKVPLTPTGYGSLAVPASVEVYENHNWSVPHIKHPLRALAYSKDGVEIFKHSRKPIYGLQFHPEESSLKGQKIFTSILQEISRY